MAEPIFVDLNGNTARVDPPSNHTGYMRLTIYTAQSYDEGGEIAHRGQVAECYIKAEQARALADALLRGTMTQ